MDSYNFLPDNEVTEVEGRKYLNPNLVVDETNTFIDRLRNTQQANMQQTATQTQRLGTDVPSNLGGLTGAGSYWSSRYVTPQTSSAVSNLRAAAQAQALNQALANEQERWKQKYNNAYRSYQKRSGGGSGSSGGSGGNDGNSSTWDGTVTDKATGLTATEDLTLDSNTPGDFGEGVTWTVNPATVGQELLEFIRIDTTKPLSDPERETYYRQKSKDDPTLVRVR